MVDASDYEQNLSSTNKGKIVAIVLDLYRKPR